MAFVSLDWAGGLSVAARQWLSNTEHNVHSGQVGFPLPLNGGCQGLKECGHAINQYVVDKLVDMGAEWPSGLSLAAK